MPRISPKNHSKNAPWWWKRLETALTWTFTGLIPLIGLSTLLPEDIKKEISLVALPILIIGVRGIGILITGEEPVKPKP